MGLYNVTIVKDEWRDPNNKADMALYSIFAGLSLQGTYMTRHLNRKNPIEAKVKSYTHINP